MFILTEFIDGHDLFELLSSYPDLFTEDAIQHVAASLLVVLSFLHTPPQVIVFRDLKPENIMVTAEGQIKLVDFGIARWN